MKLISFLQIMPFGQVEYKVLNELSVRLRILSDNIEILEPIPLLESAFDPIREQYLSDDLLGQIKRMKNKNKIYHILGITNADIYSYTLNYVFGQAQMPGCAAIISLFRLRMDDGTNAVFLDRMFKEAVHELGHNLGLRHCPDIFCVMHFSNSLVDTDIKGEKYCKKCQELLEKIKDLGKTKYL